MSVLKVYRYYQSDFNNHLYTTNEKEIGTTTQGHKGDHNYICEGVGFTVFTQHCNGLSPIFRYFNSKVNDHFYTTNAAEIGTTTTGKTGNNGYVCEGILGYISPNEFPGGIPIHRYFLDNKNDHFYTSNVNEIGTITVGHKGNHGYKYEGILGYAYPAEHHLNMVHRYYHEGVKDHFYTTDKEEIGTTIPGAVGKHGYKSEGLAFYIFTHHHLGLKPVYRYYKDNMKNHFYTANPDEIGTTEYRKSGKNGYVSEGVLGYMSPVNFSGSIPVYRYYCNRDSDHFYTVNPEEIGTSQPGLTSQNGYTCEGILGYVPHH